MLQDKQLEMEFKRKWSQERPIHLHTQTSHKNTKLEDTIILKGPVRSRREAKNMSKKYKNKSNEIKIN